MNKEDWIWMPHPAHFIGARECNFRLSTYVGGYIVSTIGEYRPFYSNKLQEISLFRKYETMIFLATKGPNACCPYVVKDYSDLDMVGYNTAEDAMKGHYAMCETWAKK
jgi:hypothetical protein